MFSEHGFDAASLQAIAAAAGLSRGTPSYFFGSKEQLYRAVIERVVRQRHAAGTAALEPVRRWCTEGEDLPGLRAALTRSVEDYMSFLISRPAFARLIAWEELAGAARLRAANRKPDAVSTAFSQVKKVARRQGLRSFSVDDAVLVFVALAHAPLAHENTLMAGIGRNLDEPGERRRQVRLAVDQLMFILAGRTG